MKICWGHIKREKKEKEDIKKEKKERKNGTISRNKKV